MHAAYAIIAMMAAVGYFGRPVRSSARVLLALLGSYLLFSLVLGGGIMVYVFNTVPR